MDHVLFWVITVGFHMYTRIYLLDQAGWGQFLLEIVVRNGLLAFVIFTNIHYLVPLFFNRRRYLSYAAGLIVCFLIYVVGKNTHDVFLPLVTGNPVPRFWQHSFYNFSIALFYVTFSLALHLSKEWYALREHLRELKMEKLGTELEYLKAQLNPHFLFNSLNTIFVQIDKTNVRARDTLTKFSDMLRYQLYECNGRVIPLKNEVEYLRNYIDLQRLRKDEKYEIDFETSGARSDIVIAPLLLMPLVENAFKHVSHFPEGKNSIQVNISVNENEIFASVTNTKNGTSAGPGGIGLKNLRRRLELEYPGKHQLTVRGEERQFVAELRLITGP